MAEDAHPSPKPDAARRKAGVGRRTFLKVSAAGVAAAGVAGVAGGAGGAGRPVPLVGRSTGGRAKNVIFMVSDGMSFGTLQLADLYSRLDRGSPTHWVSLLDREGVRRGLYRTESVDSHVTDSAASGSAWGCGHKVRNGSVNVTEDGVQQVPMLIRAAQNGKATGLVSTARVTHATPASFIANIPRRDWEGQIGRQMMERRCDVMLGGGSRFFPPSLMRDHADAALVHTREQLLAAEAGYDRASVEDRRKRMVGLFSDMHVPFVLDRDEKIPSLAEMTRAALGRLAWREEGFVLQVEGGRIDHAAHSNDAASLVREQIDFDEAIAEVLRFVERRDDTLVILTTDHGNANPGLTLYGKQGQEAFAKIRGAKRSFEWVKRRLVELHTAEAQIEQGPAVLEQAVGVSLDEDEKRILRDAMQGRRTSPFLELASLETVMGGLLANHFGVSFVSGNHTADMVEVTALGPGSQDLRPTGHNADLHGLVAGALGLAPGAPLDDMKDRVEFPRPPSND